MCVLYTQEIGGVLILEFDENGNLELRTEAKENDFSYDEIGGTLRIKELRKAMGLTQEKLSEKIGISCQGLKMIECGINGARIDTFVYLAEALDTTIDYLVLGRSCMVIDEE